MMAIVDENGRPMPTDPAFSKIARLAVDSFFLTPQMRQQLRNEMFKPGITYDQLSDFARQMYDVTKAEYVAGWAAPANLDELEHNRLWSMRDPEKTTGVTSKAGLMAYLGQKNMTLEQFMKTPMYTLNKEYWNALNV
jgi:hypothetical protein